jgi:hypothetical protein
VLAKDFYNDNVTDNDDDNNWDLIIAESTNFEKHISTLQSVDLLGTSDDADAGLSQAAGRTSNVPSVTLRVDDEDFPPPTLQQELPVTTDDLVDEVFVTQGGIKLHFIERKGFTQRTHDLKVISLEEAKADGRTLCKHCSELQGLRTPQCCSPGCGFKPTWNPHFCCKRCRDGLTGLHGRLCSRIPYHAVVGIVETGN